MDTTARNVGRRVRLLRKAKHLTQERLGELAGLDPKYIGAVEAGSYNLTLKTLGRIARGLNVEIYELFLFRDAADSDAGVRRAIEKLIKEADRKKLRAFFNVLRALVEEEA